jgi:H+/Cl- antiporter ClcA
MTEFFRGWKRKCGLFTLLLALAFMGIWGRSKIATQHIALFNGIGTQDSMSSWNGTFVWRRYRFDESRPRGFFADQPLDINWRWYGIGVSDLQNNDGSSETVWYIPYWFFITPLTLISAFLLHFKPRQSALRKTPEPIPEKLD